MRLTTSQINWLAKHPGKSFRDVPQILTKAKDSPLADLLESLPKRLLTELKGVRVSPDLGYQTGQQFHNAAQLLNWLNPPPNTLAGRSWPAESYRIKHFRKKLTIQDLLEHTSGKPAEAVLRYYNIDL